MRCRNCGAEIPEGQLICPACHMEVQIVPDYNPLEDVLAREVKGSVEYATRPIDSSDLRRYRSREERENDYATRVLNQGEYRSSTRVLSQGEMSRIRSQYTRTPSQSRYGNGNTSARGTDYVPRNPGNTAWDSGYAGRTAGNGMRGTGYTGRTAGSGMRETGYTGRNTGSGIRETGYAGRNTGSGMRETGYAGRNTGSGMRETGYAGRNTGSGIRETGYAGRNTGSGMRETGYAGRTAGNGTQGYTGAWNRDGGYAAREAGAGLNEGYDRREGSDMRRNTGSLRRETSGMHQTDSEGRRQGTGEIRQDAQGRQQRRMRKKRSAKKRMQKVLTVFCMILAAGAVLVFFLYQNSYAGAVGKGQKALQSGEYTSAESYFEQALRKDVKKAEAYTGLAKVYIQQKNLDKAEEVFITAIDSQPENADLYDAAIRFYLETEQTEKISPLLDGCDASVLSKVSDYVSEAPKFSMEEGTYKEVQEIALTGDGDIYYTDDGSTPTQSSTPYTEPILLNDGTTVLKAVCINKKGIPSLTATRTYTVEREGEGAPAVNPSTGKYSEAFQISIQVPEGYTAYYTTDGSTPSAASQMYTGPLDVTEGNGSLIFSAVLISDAGKMTPVTKRNYTLQFE